MAEQKKTTAKRTVKKADPYPVLVKDLEVLVEKWRKEGVVSNIYVRLANQVEQAIARSKG